jgi:hypothetical protein
VIQQHLPFFLILGSGLLLTVIMLFVRYLQWRKIRPTHRWGMIGVHFEKGAVSLNSKSKWPHGLVTAIDVIERETLKKFGNPQGTLILDQLWIRVVPRHGLIHTPTVRTGYVTTDRYVDGQLVRGKARALGSITTECFLPALRSILPVYNVLVILQTEISDTDESLLVPAPANPDNLREPGETALFHEFAEHHAAQILGRGPNAAHTDAELRDFGRLLKQRYQEHSLNLTA